SYKISENQFLTSSCTLALQQRRYDAEIRIIHFRRRNRMKLIATAFHWLGKQFMSLLVIILILIVGGYLYSGIQSYLKSSEQMNSLETGRSSLKDLQIELEAQAKRQVESIDKKSRETLDRRIAEIDRAINGLESKRNTDLERKIAFVKGDFAEDFAVDLRIDLLKQER